MRKTITAITISTLIFTSCSGGEEITITNPDPAPEVEEVPEATVAPVVTEAPITTTTTTTKVVPTTTIKPIPPIYFDASGVRCYDSNPDDMASIEALFMFECYHPDTKGEYACGVDTNGIITCAVIAHDGEVLKHSEAEYGVIWRCEGSDEQNVIFICWGSGQKIEIVDNEVQITS